MTLNRQQREDRELRVGVRNDRADRVEALYRSGKTPAEVASDIGCSVQYVHKIRRKRKIPPHHPRVFDDATVRADVALRYRRGESVDEIAAATGLPRTGIYTALRSEGVSLRPSISTEVLDAAAPDLITKYQEGRTLANLAEEYGCSEGGVRNALLRHGVVLRTPTRQEITFTPGEQARILQLRRTGMPSLAIAREMGYGERTVARFLASVGQNKRVKRERVVGSGGYVLVRDATDKYVMEHRHVMAEALGRPLEAWETVHHIDGDITNNNLANLQLRQGRHGKGIVVRCMDCGSHNVEAAPLNDPG